MIELLAHAGHAHGGLASWQLVLIALLYLSLAAGLGVGILIGKRNQQPVAPGYRASVRDLRPDKEHG
jgi:hypothetical protein